jgi:hypothetical protein
MEDVAMRKLQLEVEKERIVCDLIPADSRMGIATPKSLSEYMFVKSTVRYDSINRA